MSEYERKVLQDLSVLEAQMQELLGIGQPGRLHALEGRVERHEKSLQRMKGLAGAWGGLLTLVHLAIAVFGGKQ